MNPKSFIASNQKSPWLITALAVSFPLLFVNALSESYPMGYAGLFTQMARQIADANFQLPIESPFYGPGGIPFAYPPFGLYLLAILIKVTGKYFFFLRILPPMLSLISLIPLFYLTLHLSKSPLAAGMIVILTAASPNLYEAHAWAAGMVRASAFLFMLCTLYFFVKHNSQPTLLNLLSAGMLLGLTLLSHLTYFLFCMAWIGWWTVSSGKFFLRFKDAAIVVLLGLLTSSMWWLTIIFRYGFGVFVKAFNSHGGDSLLSVWQNVPGIFASFWINLESLTANIWLFALVVIGVIALVVKKNLQLILFSILIVLFFPEKERFIYLTGCLIAGMGISILHEWAGTRTRVRNAKLWIALFVLLVITPVWWDGYQVIRRQAALLGDATLQLAESAKEIMPPNQTYLALVKQNEAEWLPFLLQREPVVAQWGSEWLGEYNRQTSLMSQLGACQREQDWGCVERIIQESRLSPDFVITYVKDKVLQGQIESTDRLQAVYLNERYILWQFFR